MALSLRPSHRNPEDLQPEVCDLCGAKVGHQHLIDSDIVGLQGFKICGLHSFERRARVTPSYDDYRREGSLPFAVDTARLEPIGGLAWWIDPELEE